MKLSKIFTLVFVAAVFSACVNQPANNSNAAANAVSTNAVNASASPAVQNLSEVARPQKIVDMMKERGGQDEAKPILKVVEPKEGATISSSTVKVKLELSGDLKGYKPMKDMATGMGNHIHLILDNLPYEPFYNAENEFEFRNVADGEHTLRVFPSRPWHESYKNEGAFQMVKFTVKDGKAETAAASPMPEGKNMPSSMAGAVDAKKPLLTYSRPKGEYKNADADAIMIDFWLSGDALLHREWAIQDKLHATVGNPYRVRYSIDGGEAKYIDKWEPIWLTGWTNGKHTIKLELIDKDGKLVDNGGYNSTTREITVSK